MFFFRAATRLFVSCVLFPVYLDSCFLVYCLCSGHFFLAVFFFLFDSLSCILDIIFLFLAFLQLFS